MPFTQRPYGIGMRYLIHFHSPQFSPSARTVCATLEQIRYHHVSYPRCISQDRTQCTVLSALPTCIGYVYFHEDSDDVFTPRRSRISRGALDHDRDITNLQSCLEHGDSSYRKSSYIVGVVGSCAVLVLHMVVDLNDVTKKKKICTAPA